jgi:hypothetical protein
MDSVTLEYSIKTFMNSKTVKRTYVLSMIELGTIGTHTSQLPAAVIMLIEGRQTLSPWKWSYSNFRSLHTEEESLKEEPQRTLGWEESSDTSSHPRKELGTQLLSFLPLKRIVLLSALEKGSVRVH